MKRALLPISIVVLLVMCVLNLHASVTYKLTYNSVTQVYTVSFNSSVAYSGAFSRITPSTQFTLVVPDPDGAGPGAFVASNLTNLTALNMGLNQINSPAENPSKDYLFFTPINAGSYSLFNIPANTDINLFSFNASVPCSGTLYLFDNITDPLNNNPNINADNNFRVLGGGNVNLYTGNSSGPLSCPPCSIDNITAVTSNVTCFGGADGVATIIAADGTPPYAYAWPPSAGNQTTQTVSNLMAGTYMVTVTDAASCTGTLVTTITEPPLLTASASVAANILCFGGATGSVSVATGGGTMPYSLLWTGGSTNQTVTGLIAGTYTVTVTDANGCIKTSSATIMQPAQPLDASIGVSTNVSCAGGSNGTAMVTGSGGTIPYSYLWSNGQTAATATGLSAGSYTVTITDANSCTATASVVITAPAALTASISAQTNVLCFGASTGTATVSVTGGSPAFSYLWPATAGNQTTATATGLAAGLYTVTVTDGNGCTAIANATITQPGAALIPVIAGVNVSCGGANNGSATANVTGGTPGYAYAWSNGSTTASAINLGLGTYTVTVTDQNGCTASASVVIGQNTGSVNYKLTLDPDGQTYRVSFNSSIGYTGSMARITGSTQFTLVFPDPDGAGAGAVQLIDVTSSTALDMDYTQLNSPAQSLSRDYAFFAPTNAGAYTLFNIPANTDIELFTFKILGGCSGTVYLFDNYADPLNSNPIISADNSFKTLGGGNTSLYCNNATGPVACSNCVLSNITAVTTDVTCFGGANGAATVIAADGVPDYAYAWPPSAGNQTTQTVTNLVAGTYTVTVTDAVGCTGTVALTIAEPPLLTATASVVANVLCFGGTTGSVTVATGGGSPNYSLLWTGGSTDQTVTGLAAGTYTVTVTDSKGCTKTSSATVAQPAQALNAAITAITNVSCFGGANGTATVTAGGGTSPYSYLWSNGQTVGTATGLSVGTYTVTVTDTNNCTQTTSATITAPTALTASVSAQTNVLCFGASTGSATIVASGGTPTYSYLWPALAGNQTTATGINLVAGGYIVTVTDGNMCTKSVTVTITQPASALSASATGINVSCGGTNNGSATATVTGGIPAYGYAWSNGSTTSTAINLGLGTYTVTVTDQNSCTATSNVVIGQNTGSVNYKLTLDPDGQTYRVSFNSSIAYTGSFARITGSTQFTLVFPDPDGAGGGAIQLANITSLTALDMDYTQLNSPAENPGADYVFFAPTNAGAYTVFDIPANTDIDLFTFKIPSGCTGFVSLYDNYADPLNADPNVGADNSFKTLGGGNASLYCNNATGPVACSNCLLSNITAVTTDVTCFGGANGAATIIVADGVPQYSYAWPPSAGNQTTQTVTNLVAGTYTVTVTDGVGCTGTVTLTIAEPPVLTATASVVANVLCFGGTTGSVTVATGGGSPNYSLLWTGGSTDQTVTGLAAGTYTVTVTDSKGCSKTSSATVTQPAQALNAAITAITNVSCFGGASGTATVTAGGGTSPYSYLWSNGQTVATATGLSLGTYTVTITDANNCTQTTSASITEPTALTASVSAQTNVLCFGASTGSATIVASGGTPIYSYLWPASAGNQTTATGINLAAGGYIVTVTDGNMCTKSVTVTITQPASALSASATGINVSCGGTNNGSATASVTGGTPTYTYVWTNGATTATTTGLVVGTYTVTVTDQNGCTATSDVVIDQNTGSVNYKLTLDPDGQTYRVSFNSSIAYTGSFARITGSTQFTLVFPDPDGAGGAAIQLANITSLTALDMDYTQLNSPAENPGADYVFFAPTNAGAYTVFDIPANTDIDLFTFKIPSGCTGFVSLYDNYADPLNADPNVGADNSFKTLGGGNASLYCNNATGPVACSNCLLSNITAVTTDVTCFGGANGAATIIVADGVPQYSYAWPPSAGNQTTQTVTNLVAGTYTVTVTDGVGCTGTVTLTIAEPPVLTATASVVANVLCFGGTTGSVTVATGGGSPNYSLLWTGGSTDQTVTGLAAGTYTVTVTDSKGCSKTSSATVTQPAQALNAAITAITNVSCFGGANGTATVTAGGGTSPYSYLWSNGQTVATATGLSLGTYTVTITDANNCTQTTSASITEPTALTASVSAQTNVLCFGASTGSATIVASGGTPIYSYLWPASAGNQTTATGINLAAGGYIVTVTDGNMCTKSVTVTITQPASALSASATGINVSCGGTNNGSATASVTGGTPTYTYVWTNGATTATTTGLVVGTYTVTVTDQNGCTATSDVVIDQNTGSVNYKLTLDPDGQTYRVSFNSSIAYTGSFARITGSTQFTLVFPDPDGAGGAAIQLANITSLTALDMDYTQLNSPAENPGADYVFFAPTNAGAYTVFDIPANTDIDLFTFKIPSGCTGFVSLYDNYADPLNADPNVGADNSFKTLGGGNTSLYCNNATGPVACSACLLSNITIFSTNVTCFGGANGSATATAADGVPVYSYLWSNAATTQTISNLIAGIYTVTITDGVGCTGTATVTITEPAVLTASAAQVTPVSCFGGSDGSAAATAGGGTPGYTYEWSNGSTDQTATLLAAGTYTVTITDSNGCTKTAEATITEPATAVSVTTTQVNVSCFGGSDGTATATGVGGTGTITYLWSNGQTTATATGLTAGTYNVTATDANGCTASASVVITELPQLTATITAQTNVLCNGMSTGAATATAGGGTTPYSYLWSDGQTTATATNLAAGTYTVTITDAKGCTAATSVTITQPTLLIADITGQVNIGCNGASTGSATVNATGGTTAYTYLWSDGQTTAIATNLAAGTYTVVVTDANNCTASATVTIIQAPALTASASQVTPVSCFGGADGSAAATAGGGTPGYTYEWSNGSTDQTATLLAAGIYTVTITDSNGCTKSAEATITEPATAVSVTTTQVNVSCFGGSDGTATATGTGGTGTITYLWSNGQTTATATSLTAGTYNVTATDANGCTAAASVVITELPQLTATITAQTNVLCNGQTTGSATVTAGGGTTPYSYLWSDGQTTATATNLAAGTYTVTITDAKGCTAATSVTITQPTLLIADITGQVNIGCNGANTGSATVNATGGTTAYTYLWSDGQTTAMATGLTAGTYTVVVTDANSCTASATATIIQAPALTASADQVTAVSCFGGADGSAAATAGGGTPGYTYEWSNGSTDQTATLLAAGIYTVTITDSNGCTKSAEATITEPATAVSVTTTQVNVSCFGGSDGTATATGTGGTGTITYLWSNGQTTATATGLTAGTYNVTATDANGCTAAASVVITELPQLTATITAQTNVLCNGQTTGSATVTAGGGTTPYSYLWSDGQTTATATNLAAGTYTVTITDAKGCTAATSVTITQPTLLIADITGQVNIGCNGANTGSATVNATGGTTAYTYLWSDGQTTAMATGLTADTYTVVVTDANSCTASATATIIQAPALTASAAQVAPVSCFGGSDGSAAATAGGGTPGYTYEWSNGSTDQTATLLAAGIYTVTITDSNGCTKSAEATITEPATAVSVTTTQVNVSCFGGSDGTATATGTGGTGTITYLWSNGQTTATATSLTAGTYNVTATDANGCTAAASVVITELPQLTATITAQTNVLCNGQTTGSATVTAGGGTTPYSYLWSDGQTTATATNLAAGTYTVTITDAKGCSAATSVTITQPTLLIADITNQVNIGCNGANTGSATVNATGGTTVYTYQWSDGQTTAIATNLAAGTYTVVVTDANNCTASATVTIIQAPALTASASQVTPVSCFGGADGSAAATAGGGTPGYTYEWSNGSTDQTATGLAAGTYTVTITDAANCTKTAEATITEPTTAVSVTTTQVNVSCFGGSDGTATATGVGGTGTITYLWSNGQTTAMATGLTAGTYNVTATDANGCSASASVVITELPQLTATITAQTNVLCNGMSTGAATVTAGGGTTPYSYLWNDGQTLAIATNLAAGTYTVTITDAKGCTAATSVTITQPTLLIADITGQVNIGCNGANTGSATVNATGGTTAYSYLWSNTQTTATATGLTAGMYTVVVTDANNCTASATVTIIQAPALTASAAQVTAVSCFGGADGSAAATAGGGTPGYTYEWSNGSTDQTATLLAAGTYTVTITDSNGCTKTAEATISQPATAVSVTTTQVNVSCFGGSDGTATATGMGGTGTITYLWSNGQTTATATSLTAGTYNVTATDANGCTAAASVVITELPQLTATITAQTNVLCNGQATGAATVTAGGGTTPYSYLWSDGQTIATATNLAAGTYTVTITDANGCTAATSVTITQPTLLIADITDQVNIGCNGANTGSATVNATGGTTAYTYLWSDGQTTAIATNLAAGTYTVVVTDANNCTASATVTIIQAPALTASAAQVTPVSCFGGADGSAAATAGGGTPGYTYEWSNGSTDQTATELVAGTYTVTITDAANCTKTAEATITEPATAVSATISGTNVNCFGGSNGTATVIAGDGTPGYSYLWNNGQTMASISGLTAGVYEVTVTDANGCTVVKQITISQPMQLTAFITVEGDVVCNGGTSGLATVTPIGGTPGYSYLWSDGQTTATATNLAAGTYTVTITDANSCTAFTSVTIAQPTLLVAQVVSTTNETCNGANDGAATVSATGGITAYTFTWPGALAGPTQTGLAAGTYLVTVTDANNCTATTSVVINAGATLSLSSLSNLSALCPGAEVDDILLNANPPNPATVFTWTGGAAVGLVDGSSTGINPFIPGFTAALIEGSATVTVTGNLNGCISMTTFTITIDDTTTPVFTNCPSNLTFNNDVDLCSAVVTWAPPTATDDCSTPTIMLTGGPAPGTVLNVGAPVTVTYQASDLGGNTAICAFTVQVKDVQTPTAICNNITLNLSSTTNAGAASVTASQINGGSTDNCTVAGSLILTPAMVDFTCANIGNNNVTLTVTDAAGNSSSCVATVTIRDVTPPVFTCPAPVTVSSCAASVPDVIAGITATDNCGIAGIAQNPVVGTDFTGPIQVTVTVTDVNGNSSTCIVPVTPLDNTPPTFQNCPTTMVMIGNDPDQCSGKINWTVPTATDDCSSVVTVMQTGGPASGSVVGITCPPTPTTITYKATDSAGNMATCSFQIMVVDTQKPAFNADITMPTNITVECHEVPINCVFHGNGICSPLTLSDVNDNCAGPLTISFNEATTKGADPNDCSFYNYTLTRTWTVTDCAGNSRQHTQIITVHDTTKPTAICKNITVTLNDFGTVSILPRDLDGGSTDNCAANANLTFTASQTVFTCGDFANSPVMVTLTVTDPCGNFSTCTALVTILQGNGDCTPEYDVDGSDPCICLDNATTLTNGQFAELIQIHGIAGQTWTIVTSTGLYLASSPAPPAAPVPVPGGTLFTSGLLDGIDNDGDGQTDEMDEQVYYTFMGRHVDGLGYNALVRSNLNQEITLANKCYYPTPYFADFLTNDQFCLGTPPFNIAVGEYNNAAGMVVPGSVMVDGIPTTIFDAAQLGVGSHTVMATFDAGVAQPFTTVNGMVVTGSDAEALADPGCKQKITQIVHILETPNTLICNDLIYVSMDADCKVTLGVDDVLEGTYYCYDDYLVEVDKTLPLGNGPWLPAMFDASDIGHTYGYHVSHTTGGPNVCWGQVKIEDKLAPALVCPNDITIACSESTDVSHTGNIGITDCSATTTVVDDEYTDYGLCQAGPRGLLVRTWIVTDAWGNQSLCTQHITITPFDLTDVVFPADTSVDCETTYLNSGGIASIHTGEPTINGASIVGSTWCGAQVGYTDTRYNGCGGTFTILRVWGVLNNCVPLGPGNPISHTQKIEVKDLGGPVFSCPDAVTVSTDPLGCCATAALPNMIVSEGCSHIIGLEAKVTGANPNNGNIITFTVGGHLEDFPGNNWWTPDTLAVFNYTQCLPLGTYQVRYKASDECGNTSYCFFDLTVADLVPPVASCDQTTTVAINSDDPTDCYTPADGCDGAGVTWVKAKTFDDGSYDNCNQVKFTVRRMAPYSDCINGLSHDPCYPNGMSEFDLATAELDSIKFYCCEVGATETVILRVYQIDVNGNFVPGIDGTPLYNECMIQVEVQDKIKPICQPPANVSVTCEQFDPTLWLYGKAEIFDNCCLDQTKVYQGQCGLTHTVNYAQFDTVCNKGTITRTFRAYDCHGQSSQCTQRIVVSYEQDYYVKFPNDVIITVCDGTGNYGEPTFFGEDCELLGVSYEDAIFTVVPDACFKIERNWKIINWCTYNPNGSCINVPNPTPNAISNHPTNLPGPIVSPIQTVGDPWKSTIVKVNSTDANTTNYSVYYDPNANCYTYKQIIKIIDTQDPEIECPASPVTVCDLTSNDPQLWNQSYWWDNGNQSHDLCEAPSDICITATDACSGANINIEYQLFLDLDGDGIMETLVNSTQLGNQAGGLGWNNVLFGNVTGAGQSRQFDGRPVPQNQKWGFAIQETVTGNKKTACVKFNTFQSQSTYVTPELPHGTHKIKWIVSDGCGNESVCEYTIIVKDCKAPTVVCLNGLSVNIMPTGMIQLWATDFLQYAEDNCTLNPYLKYGIRKCGTAPPQAGFPVDANGNPITNVTFTCDELGTQCVELWAMDLAGNADYCETYVIVQDNNGNCGAPGAVNVSGALKTEAADGVEEATVEIAGAVNLGTPFTLNDVTGNDGLYAVNGSIPQLADITITPTRDDNPLNGVTTYDLVLISKHILGIEPLGSPYKMIAADANKSNSITTFDIVELRKLILGIYQELPGNTSWRFVDKAYVFPNPANPFMGTIPENITIPQVAINQLDQDFVGIKIGDVNNTVVANSLMTTDDRAVGTLLFNVDDREVKAGDEFEVTFKAAEKTLGYQMTLNLNGLDVSDLSQGDKGNGNVTESNFGVFKDPSAVGTGALTVSINDADAFTVKFRATKSGKLSQMLGISSRITHSEAYGMQHERLDVALRYSSPAGMTISSVGFELYQNQPNPFENRTMVGFNLPEAATATLTVFDENGRMVFSQKGDFAKGYNVFTLERQLIGTTGALWYRVETSTDSATRTMIQSK